MDNTGISLDEAEVPDGTEAIIKSIIHVLEIWPILSPTLIQGALGPQVKAAQWRPVLEELIQNGTIKQETITKQSPAGRHNDYQRLSLSQQS